DVFQIVFSRQFEQDYQGDDLQVYRALRSINPSPYLFYFDFGNYRMFGSSPEAQLIVRDRQAEIHPIAGTFAMDADPAINELRANALLADPKENAEHVMLVDLARNDLNRHAVDVHVAALREIHAYSHVMHLVSKVKGRLADSTNPIQVFADTFPAGTLSGAPKYRALELIHQYENQHRGAYGGAIGYIDLQGNMNQAIMIRSFFSQNQTLYSQAGAGIVLDSVAETELQEVNHKLGALQKALAIAETI
ncbi:MAG: anthranilate synthase component I family protein, partial [Saprospiraceae bacterium]|nr:anthranilate synthase component I family protein [Saprospiraceae bacterium]